MKIEIEVEAMPGQPVFYIEGNKIKSGFLHSMEIELSLGTHWINYRVKKRYRFKFFIGYMSLRGWREKQVEKISLTREGLLNKL